jgi:hypothetical protein
VWLNIDWSDAAESGWIVEGLRVCRSLREVLVYSTEPLAVMAAQKKSYRKFLATKIKLQTDEVKNSP